MHALVDLRVVCTAKQYRFAARLPQRSSKPPAPTPRLPRRLRRPQLRGVPRRHLLGGRQCNRRAKATLHRLSRGWVDKWGLFPSISAGTRGTARGRRGLPRPCSRVASWERGSAAHSSTAAVRCPLLAKDATASLSWQCLGWRMCIHGVEQTLPAVNIARTTGPARLCLHLIPAQV